MKRQRGLLVQRREAERTDLHESDVEPFPNESLKLRGSFKFFKIKFH